MNKKNCILFEFYIFLVFAMTNMAAQSLDQVLASHYSAMGHENLSRMNAIKYYGVYKNHFLNKINKNLPACLFYADIELTVVRNKNYLLKIRNEPGTFIIGYSSSGCWNGRLEGSIVKWTPIDNDRLLIQLKIDFEGFLYHSEEKGIHLRKLQDNKFNGITCYRIEAITPESDTLCYYINSKNYLLEKISFGKEIKEGEHHIYIAFSDYRNIEGVQMPFRIMNNIKMLDGSFGKKEEILSRIEFNPEINPSIFEFENY